MSTEIVSQTPKKLQVIWDKTLAQLQLQMTQATFEANLQHTRLIGVEGDTYIVEVSNKSSKDWLEGRLDGAIARALSGVVGRSVEVRYEVRASEPLPPPGKIAVELFNFDVMQAGYVITPHYVMRFWQPYLGPGAFHLWLTLRSFGFQADREAWPSIQTLADICTNGNRQTILGRAERAGRGAVVGLLEVLEREKLVFVTKHGEGRMTSYTFKVRETLPILTPKQIAILTPRLQDAHERFLKKYEVNLKEWETLIADSLLMSGT